MRTFTPWDLGFDKNKARARTEDWTHDFSNHESERISFICGLALGLQRYSFLENLGVVRDDYCKFTQ